MTLKKFLPLLLLFPVVLFMAGCRNGDGAEKPQPPAAPDKLINVQVVATRSGDLAETFTLPGTLEAWEDLTLAAELAGAVRWTGPEEGTRLSPGQEILRIDPDTMQANLAQAQADYDLRRKLLERVRKLQQEGYASRQELDDAESAFAVAAATLERSRVALEKSSVKSPVAGVLDRRLVERGEYVHEGTAVASVVQVDRLKVLVDLPEKDVPFLQVGQTVRVRGAEINGRQPASRQGVIRHIAYKADPATRTYRTKVEVDNADGALRPGMIVRGTFLRRTLQDVVAIPLYALVDRDGIKTVFVEESGVARLHQVTPGAVIGDRVVIRSGLQPGERLIVSGQQLLADGARVRVVAAPAKGQ